MSGERITVVAVIACNRVQEAPVSLVQLKVKSLACFETCSHPTAILPVSVDAARTFQPLGTSNYKRHRSSSDVRVNIGSSWEEHELRCFLWGLCASVAQLLALQYICSLAVPWKLHVEVCLLSSFLAQLPAVVVLVTWLYLLVSGCSESMAYGRDVVAVLTKLVAIGCCLLFVYFLGAEVVSRSLWGAQCNGITTLAEKGSGKI